MSEFIKYPSLSNNETIAHVFSSAADVCIEPKADEAGANLRNRPILEIERAGDQIGLVPGSNATSTTPTDRTPTQSRPPISPSPSCRYMS